MIKFAKLKSLAAIAGACASLFSAAPANAFVYAVSRLEIQNLNISLKDVVSGATVSAASNYEFSLTNNASIKPAGGPTQGDSGTNSCSGVAGGSTTCSLATPVLNADVANAPGGTLVRAENNFAILGSSLTQSFSNSDSQISTSELVQGIPTSSVQIAESLLNFNGNADADTKVFSRTTLVATFTVGGNILKDLNLAFNADSDIFGQIQDVLGGVYSSSAGSNVTVSLTKNGTGGKSLVWTPDGDGTNGCKAGASGAIVGVTCGSETDSENLNASNSVSDTPDFFNINYNSLADFVGFGITFKNLDLGTYSLALTANTNTNISRVNDVPEPGSLALIGLALAGLGLSSKRRSRQ